MHLYFGVSKFRYFGVSKCFKAFQLRAALLYVNDLILNTFVIIKIFFQGDLKTLEHTLIYEYAKVLLIDFALAISLQ